MTAITVMKIKEDGGMDTLMSSRAVWLDAEQIMEETPDTETPPPPEREPETVPERDPQTFPERDPGTPGQPDPGPNVPTFPDTEPSTPPQTEPPTTPGYPSGSLRQRRI